LEGLAFSDVSKKVATWQVNPTMARAPVRS
jgi:hypothetical protein